MEAAGIEPAQGSRRHTPDGAQPLSAERDDVESAVRTNRGRGQMKSAGWERWAPLSGIVFFGLTIPTLFLPAKAPPGAGDPAAKWAAFVQDHRSAYLVSVCLSGLAVVAF